MVRPVSRLARTRTRTARILMGQPIRAIRTGGASVEPVAADDGQDAASPCEPRRSYEGRGDAVQPVDIRATESSRPEIRPGYDAFVGVLQAVPYDPATGFSRRLEDRVAQPARHSVLSRPCSTAPAGPPDGWGASCSAGPGSSAPESPAAPPSPDQTMAAGAEGFSPFRPAAPMPSTSSPLPSYPGSATPVSPAYGASAPVSSAPTSPALDVVGADLAAGLPGPVRAASTRSSRPPLEAAVPSPGRVEPRSTRAPRYPWRPGPEAPPLARADAAPVRSAGAARERRPTTASAAEPVGARQPASGHPVGRVVAGRTGRPG